MNQETRIRLNAIAAEHGLTLEQIISPNKFRRHVEARKACYRYLRDERKWSTPQIAKLFHRDHSTVVWALNGCTATDEQRAAHRERYHRIKAAGEKPLGARRAG